jgi:predicted ribosomally synthesized peptide with SipW-like signal peptide
MKNRKNLIAILAILIVATIAIGGTLAYLTDTQTITNTFTVGDVEIELEEPNWVEPDAIFPGMSYPKDPTITAVRGEMFMRVILEFRCQETGALLNAERAAMVSSILHYAATDSRFNTADFTLDAARSSGAVEVFNFNGVFEEGDVVTLFDSVEIPNTWDRDDLRFLGDFEIVVIAQAIQTAGFADAAAAFTALDAATA